MKLITLSPSLICMYITKLKGEIEQIEFLGIKNPHVDILDGHFSPSNPIGMDVLRKVRSLTTMKLDVHIMAIDNDFFIDECLDISVGHITFHCETTRHIDHQK